MSNEEVIAEILMNRGIDVKDVDVRTVRKIMKDKEPQPSRKIRLSSLSFRRVVDFFIKSTERKIASKQKKLQTIKQEMLEEGYTLSKTNAAKLSKKIVKLESQINVLQYKQRMKQERAAKAIKLNQTMESCMQWQALHLYKLIKNPFENGFENETEIKNNAQHTGVSLAEQLNQSLDSIEGTQKDNEPMVSLNDFATKASETEEKDTNTTITSLEAQLNDKLDLVDKENETALPPQDTSYNLGISREGFDEIKQKRQQEIARLNGEYRLTHDEIIQDPPIEKPNTSSFVELPKGYYGNDFDRNNYQQQLDRVTGLIERPAGMLTATSDVKDVLSNDTSMELQDLIRLAQEEEREAQEVADQARLAKEEALQAAREKEESERLSAQTNQEYEQLLREAKEAIESRTQKARARKEQEQAELDRNRTLTAGIRRDSESIQAKVATRQQEISQLKTVLGQYTDTSAVSISKR